jgi:hypothetical protein
MKQERDEEKAEREKERTEHRKLVSERETENRELRGRVNIMGRRLSRAEERIRHLESICKNLNAAYPVWEDESPIELHGPNPGEMQ